MDTEEYLPPENVQNAMAVPDASELETRAELIRIQCSLCSKEVGHHGTPEHALSLIEKLGWKVGAKIICPACVEKTARKFFKRYNPES